MLLSWKQLEDIALATLTDEERQNSAVYSDFCVLPNQATLTINHQTVTVTGSIVVVFVDLQPGANWSHPCRYLLINVNSGEVRVIEGQFPPHQEHLKLLQQGDQVEDWMLLTREKNF